MPQIFEFHFNPPKQKKLAEGKADLIFDSFCFEPQNVYEKKVGSLYMTGVLKNAMPQNIRFLDVLAQKIKEKYYKSVSLPPEKSLRESLKAANEHLEKTAKQGDVSWLGNLSFAAISLKDYDFNFAKVGDLKIMLLRDGYLVDIDQKVKFDDIEPYPLKIFGNVVSGKLAENDIILIFNKEVYDAFLKEKLLDTIAKKSCQISPKETKNFKDILNGKKEELTKISGIFLLIALSKEAALLEKETVIEKKKLKVFSLKEVFSPALKLAQKIKIPKIHLPKLPQKQKQKKEKEQGSLFGKLNALKPKFSSSKAPKIKIPNLKISVPKISLPKISSPLSYRLPDTLKKKTILIAILILILIIGSFIFEKREEKKIESYQNQINELQEKLSSAESYFVLAEYNPQAHKNANILYKEIWDEISDLNNILSSLPQIVADQFSDIKNTASEKLYQLNKLIEISDPEIVFEFKPKELIPQKIISFKNKLYFFSHNSEIIFELNQEEKTIETENKFNLAYPLSDSIIFFSKPNQITFLENGSLSEKAYLEEHSSAFEFAGLAVYRSHLYFLDAKNNAIVRYPFISELNWQSPELWLTSETKPALNFKSMAIDGSVWILTDKNTIERYYTGRLQETFSPEIFPKPENFSKIFTSLQHTNIYILEPSEKRIIILDKSGKLVSQIQSPKFNNLLDFAVSEDSKTIWLLNGMKVFKISL